MEVGTSARYQASGADQTSEEEKTFQAAKYHEIIEILLSAGYFRARIAGLSEFDKVSIVVIITIIIIIITIQTRQSFSMLVVSIIEGGGWAVLVYHLKWGGSRCGHFVSRELHHRPEDQAL